MGDVKKETVSAERLAELASSARAAMEAKPGMWGLLSNHIIIPPDDLLAISTELLALRQPDTSEGGGEAVAWQVVAASGAVGNTYLEEENANHVAAGFAGATVRALYAAPSSPTVAGEPVNKSPTPEHVEGDVSVGEMEVVAWAREVDINGPCLIDPAFVSKGAVDLFKYGNACANKHARFVELVRRSEAADALSSAQSSIQRAEAERDAAIKARDVATETQNELTTAFLVAEAQLAEAWKVLERISSPTQTEGLLWWQIEARAFLASLGEKQDAE